MEEMDILQEPQEPITSGTLDINKSSLLVTKPTSLEPLIVWNISKALELNPSLVLKDAITSVQCQLEQLSDTQEIQAILSEHLYERHVACALLAWQELGHKDVESLCRFIEDKRCEKERTSKSLEAVSQALKSIASKESEFAKAVGSSSCYSDEMGPVVKLPVETKLVMRAAHTCAPQLSNKPKASGKNILNKIDMACCLESGCTEQLKQLDSATKELRTRAGMLARREAERVELLERAETAWRDLELGYHRRIKFAEEKEQDLAKQIDKAVNDRNRYKDACTALTKVLKNKSEEAQKDRQRLNLVEVEVAGRACQRLKLGDQAAKLDAAASEEACRAAQLDRDLQFKEEQTRRKMLNLQSEVDSARALTFEAERAMRGELTALRDQISDISKRLLEEDSQNEIIKIEVDLKRQEKMDLMTDLEDCKEICDGRMQGKVDELNTKRSQLAELKDKVLECQCKLPIDAAVEVKRTPSLAALCKCSPEDKVMDSCSCTSLRSTLLSNLLADLFGGLQAELGTLVIQMPCQLLKCLENKHNWDSPSIVKTNLRNYFSKLLVGELNIAIATSIENYHAKWVGLSCADAAKMTPESGEETDEGWQTRAIERRAQTLATQIAEQLFQERAEQLTQQAKDIVSSGPPPCECKTSMDSHDAGNVSGYEPAKVTSDRNKASKISQPHADPLFQKRQKVFSQQAKDIASTCPPPQRCDCSSYTGTHQDAVYSCQVENTKASASTTPVYWRQAMQDVTQLRMQVEDLKKESIKKEDLKMMEDKFTKFIQRSSSKTPAKIDEAEQRAGKKNLYRNPPLGREGKMKEAAAVFPCLVKSKPPNVVTFPVYWHQAMQDVTQIRKQIQDLKKDSLKKEDLKTIEDKFAKMIQRTGGTAVGNTKTDYVVEGCDANQVIKKDQKMYKTANQTGLHIHDLNKSSTTKNLQMKKENKPGQLFNRSIAKPIKPDKKNGQIYSVNMCLCSSKNQQQKDLNDKCKIEATSWKQKCSKETVSLISSSNRQSKPINTSILSQDISLSAQSKSKGSEEQSCPSNCVCFHKMPSNSSIDKLLETLAKWKFDLDESNYNKRKSSTCVFLCESTVGNIPDIKQDFEDEIVSSNSKISFESKEKIPEQSKIKNHDCLDDSNIKDNYLNFKKQGQSNVLSKEPIGTTESEYMGAVNLEKSNENVCKFDSDIKNNKTAPFKCITSNKCSCNRIIETRKRGGRKLDLKKGNCLKVSLEQETQKQQLNNITVPETKDENELEHRKDQEKVTSNNMETNRKPLDPCDYNYQIKFLGVTLADADFLAVNESSYENDSNAYKNNNNPRSYTMRCEECQPYKTKSTKQFDQNDTHKVNDGNKDCVDNDIYKDHCKQVECLNCQKIQNLNSRNKQRKSHWDDKKDNVPEKKPSKSRLSTKDQKRQESDNHILSCHCSKKFDDFKKFISDTFAKQVINEDIALDVQSFKDVNSRDESCVCCNKDTKEETKELEHNAFHLLEEYLKKKLVEFKDSSSSHWSIPPEEEEKIFTIILQKVKQLISDSTNKIKCKCSVQDEKSQGSWSRAYGMLQEYIKMKIKKVECSCVLADDNNAILPGLLDKVCNLIECDFQRLKDARASESDSKMKENAKKYSKQVNFESEVPERDTNIVLVTSKTSVPLNSLILDDKLICDATQTICGKQNISSQVPVNLGTEIKSCDSLKIHNKNIVLANVSCHSFDKYKDCKCDPYIEFPQLDVTCNKDKAYNINLDTFKSKQIISKENEKDTTDTFSKKQHFNNSHYEGNIGECAYEEALISIDHNNVSPDNLEMIKDIMVKPTAVEHNIQKVTFIKSTIFNESAQNYQIDYIKSSNMKNEEYNKQHGIRNDDEFIESDKKDPNTSDSEEQNEMKDKKELIECSETQDQQRIIVSNNNFVTQNSEMTSLNQPNAQDKYPDVPYIGYTIDCSCNNSLGPCVCSRSITRTNKEIISNIWRNAMPNETYFKKVSYILYNQPEDNFSHITDLLEMPVDVVLHNLFKKNLMIDSLPTAINSGTGLTVLQQSIDNVDKTHAMTNTFNDSVSLDTDNSVNEDCCACSSHYNPNHKLSSSLKNSIYFPAPVVDFNLNDKSNSDVTPFSLSPNVVCNCDMVPICYVKMLVENIETKLKGSKCT